MGIGNYLMGDEGLGSHFIHRYSKQFPDHIDLLDGGTGGMHLMSFFEQYKTVILIDATLENSNPGRIKCIKPRFSKDFPKTLSTHDIGLKDLVEGMHMLGTLPDIYLFTVSISKIQQMNVSLSVEIESSLDMLKDEILNLSSMLC